ncbi:O-antigen ligase family protein [Microbacterium esteraromaticum]|uniref:O-antigen ligase family protein n=1 Tax=Microbacterium esteraromaticum TaxID=57043 RepID=UPI0019D39385|nr:O-antigen ligase family protein [Microbacterium esteraromaticum]MBN7793425.1 O-antigen ligase family protein [Microbacterium esteraromaticum]
MVLRRTAVVDALGRAWANLWRWTLFAIATLLAVYFLLDRGLADGATTAIALAVIVIGVVLTPRHPMILPLLAISGAFVTARVSIGVGDLTVSDLAIALGFVIVVLLSRRDFSPTMRAMLWLNAIYQFATLFTVIVNPYPQNTVEWFHAWMLISGALLLGWGIGRAGLMRTGLILIVATGLVVALGTIATGAIVFVTEGVRPIYPRWPWPMHKNFAGAALAFAILVVFIKPPHARLPRKLTVPSLWIMLAALALTQSRQAVIGLIVGMLLYVLRSGAGRHKVLVVLLAVPGAALIIDSVIGQIESQNRFNSTYQRLEWMREVYALWKHEPIFGHGLRYWYVHPTANFQPPQAELEVVASAGLVGLAGFGVMWLGILIVLWKFWTAHPSFGALAFAVVISRLVTAQFDLFWVAAQVSIPFLIAGICLGGHVWWREQNPNTWEQPLGGRRAQSSKIETQGKMGVAWNSATMRTR